MADKKISALTASTTPLAGTEVLPIVQSSSTVQVSVANLTAGRAISATQLTLSAGNVIVANGYGVDFSATPSTGTSELFADYEEGTWTPTDVSGAGLTFAAAVGTYTKIGRMVYLQANISYPVTGNTNSIGWGTFPFTAANGNHVNAIAWSDGVFAALNFYASTTAIYSNITSASGNVNLTNNLASGKNFRINIFYSV
jgi:hypothetical protein